MASTKKAAEQSVEQPSERLQELRELSATMGRIRSVEFVGGISVFQLGRLSKVSDGMVDILETDSEVELTHKNFPGTVIRVPKTSVLAIQMVMEGGDAQD